MKRVPFYPLALGAFVLISMYATNPAEAYPSELVVPLAIVLAATLLLIGLLAFPVGIHRSALIVAALVFCFLTYGYWVTALWNIYPHDSVRSADHIVVMALLAAVVIAVAAWAIRRAKNPSALTRPMNILSCVLLACPLLLIAGQNVAGGLHPARAVESAAATAAAPAPLDAKAPRPDIYFIVLDAHGRRDILRDQYHYDDEPFLQHLRERGFYIADQSTSNYMWTRLSIPTATDMNYLPHFKPGDNPLDTCARMLRQSQLVAELKTLGYRTVAFESMDDWLSLKKADVYYSVSDHVGVTQLQQLIIDTSALSQMGGQTIKSKLLLDRFHFKREMALFKYSIAGQVARLAGPKYVFLHIFEPHTPFVFAADGSDPIERGYGTIDDGPNPGVSDQHYHDWYREQTIYTDNQALRMIDAILANSKTPPVIVLIGDHGPRSGIKLYPTQIDLQECLSNLEAISLPGQHDRGLYPSISPVNLFRVVLDDYFNAGLPLLPDRSYYSYVDFFRLRDVTAKVRPPPATSPSGI